MHRTEARELVSCADAFGAERVLCFPCAVRRGGSYEEQHDAWRQTPELGDLPRADELEGSA